MKKLAVLLLFAASLSAKEVPVCYGGVCRMVETGVPEEPIPVVKHRLIDKKFVALTLLNIGVSVAATKSLVACRADHGIGPCTDGGYGPFPAREAVRQAFTGTMALISLKLKSIEDKGTYRFKFWWIPQAVSIGVNAGVMIQNASKNYKPKERE